MYPHERSLVKTYNNRPFAILGVNSDKDREQLQETLREKDLPWRSFFDGGGTSGPIAIRWGVYRWPTVYIIDHEGIIQAVRLKGKALDEKLEELVLAAEAASG